MPISPYFFCPIADYLSRSYRGWTSYYVCDDEMWVFVMNVPALLYVWPCGSLMDTRLWVETIGLSWNYRHWPRGRDVGNSVVNSSVSEVIDLNGDALVISWTSSDRGRSLVMGLGRWSLMMFYCPATIFVLSSERVGIMGCRSATILCLRQS